MIRRLFKDLPLKLLSLLAAVAIWLAVASEPEMATVLRVPVHYKDAPTNLEISSDIAGAVRLELVGNSGRLKDFSASPAPVVLDFSAVRTPGERTFNIDSNDIHLPKGVRLIRAVPAQLRFTFEPYEEKTVPVQVQWSGTPPSGKHLFHIDVQPKSLEIAGPKSRVDMVHSVSTDPVNVSELLSRKTLMTAPFVSEPQVRFRDFQPVRVTVILED